MAAVAVLAVAATALAAPAGADEDFVPGSAQVEARLVRLGPSAGRLSFAPSVGVSVATYTNTVGRAISRYFDFAALDDSIPHEIRDNAPVVRVESTDEGAEDGRAVTTGGTPDGSPVRAGGTTQRARAGPAPFSEADFVLGDFAPAPGQVELRGGRALTRAAVVDGETREAVGTVRFERIVLGGGALELWGATWRAVQRTGAEEGSTGHFRVREVVAGEQAVTPPDELDAPEQWAQLNEALAPLGIRIDPPRVEVDGGVVAVTPLGIRLFASAPGRSAGPPLVDALQPVREEVAGRMVEEEPEAGSLLTLGDLVTGALVGTGVVDLQVGGTTAFTEGELFDSPFGAFDLSARPAPVRIGGPSGGGSSLVASPSVGGGDDPVAGPAPSAPAGDGDVALAGNRRLPGRTGGAAATVGAFGLLAVLAMAGADWWRLRHEPRRITP